MPTNVHTRVKAVKSRLMAAAKSENKLNQEIIDAAEQMSDRASAVADQLRKDHQQDGTDTAKDMAYQSVLLTRNITDTALGSARELKRRISKIDADRSIQR